MAIAIGDRVQAGQGEDEHDHGVVMLLKPGSAYVGWDTGVQTWHDAADLEPEHDDCVECSDPMIECEDCGVSLRTSDSYSPGDYAVCAACDTAATGRAHPAHLKGATT